MSVVNLIGTQFRSRSDKPFLGNTLELYTNADLSAEGITAIKRHVDDTPRSDRPAHRYSTGSQGHMAQERHAYKKYQDYFNVPNEI